MLTRCKNRCGAQWSARSVSEPRNTCVLCSWRAVSLR